MQASWKKALGRLLAAALVAVILGWFFGEPILALTVASLVYVAWTFFNLHRFEKWLSSPRQTNPPDVPGLWGDIYYHIHRLKIKNRKRKRHFAQLLREFRKSTSAMPDGTVILNEQNQIDWFNPAAADLLALSTRRDIGHRIDNLVRNPKFVRYLESSDSDESVEIRSPVADEQRISIQLVKYGGRDQRLLLVKDVTLMANLERTRRDFVANASHELRTPLTVISGYLESMAGDQDLASGVWQAPIEKMQQQTQSMANIVKDLLELSRLESMQTQAPKQSVDVAILLERIRSEILSTAANKVEIQIKLETSSQLLGLESELYSVFSNLLHNAVKFSEPGGRVQVIWSANYDGAVLSVVDHGIGIPSEDIPRLTERFFLCRYGPLSSEWWNRFGSRHRQTCPKPA